MLQSELIPAQQQASKRLLIMLHGLGASIEFFRFFPEAMNLPWLNYLLVNAPDEYYGGYSWFDYQGDIKPGVARSRELLFELVDAQRNAGFQTGEIILGGFSQGCLMSIDLGLRYPHRLAGIVGISGWVFEPEKLLQELSPLAFDQRLLITHGLFDPMVPFADTREQINILKAAGLHIEWHEFPKSHMIAGELEISVIREFVQKCYSNVE
jgi:phospholipase/carboxylesterase